MLGLAAVLALGAALRREATPYLVVDADSDQVLMQNEATAPWYPASLTKLMTVYVALDAVRDGKLTLDTPLIMSARAARMPPSKMGFRPGTEVTLDNALKMLMVKSPNDVAVMVAEGVSGSVEAFADDMNADAQRLGLHESHFVNPNGLHNPAHVSSARDMAMIARALLREFPDHADLFDIGALQLGNQYIPNHNGLLGRYPGADGMKTGFTCPAGFNVVASANQPRAAPDRRRARRADGEIAQSGGGGPVRPRLRHGRRRRRRWNRCRPVRAPRPTCAPTSACIATPPRSPPIEDDGILPPAQGAAGLAGRRACSRCLWRRCSRRSRSRTPSFPRKGSTSIRCGSMSVPRPAGRGRCWALARLQRNGGGGAKTISVDDLGGRGTRGRRERRPPARFRIRSAPASVRGIPRKGSRRPSRPRARPAKSETKDVKTD